MTNIEETNEFESGAAAMRKTLKKTKVKVANKSLVTWISANGMYTYAAIFVNNLWYTTGGNYYVAKTMTHDEFMKYLRGADITDVKMATEFSEIA